MGKFKEAAIAVTAFISITILPLYLTNESVTQELIKQKGSSNYTDIKKIKYYKKAQSGLLLTKVLAEKGNPARWKAIDEIISLNYRKAASTLVKCLEEPEDARLVWHSIRALKHFRVSKAVPALTRLISKNTTSSIKVAALGCLGKIPAYEKRDFIYKFTNSANTGIKLAASEALAEMNDKRAIKPLMELYGLNMDTLKIKVAKAMTMLRGHAQKEILNILVGPDPAASYAAALSMNLETRPEIIKELLKSSEIMPERIWDIWKLSKASQMIPRPEFEQLEYQYFAGIKNLQQRALKKIFEMVNPNEARKGFANFMIQKNRYNDPLLRKQFKNFMKSIEKVAGINKFGINAG